MPKSKSCNSQKGSAHIVLLAVAFISALILSASSLNNSQNALAEDTLTEAQKQAAEQTAEAQKQAIEQTAETQKQQLEQSSEAQKKQTEQIREAAKQAIERSRETETVSSTGAKIKTKIEDDGTTKIEIEHGKFKLKYVSENGKVKLEAENDQGKNVGLDSAEIDTVKEEIEQDLEDEGIKISTASGRPTLIRNSFSAASNFPLSINLDTKELIVTTPNGQKVVTILPDAAITNLLKEGIISQTNQQAELQQRGNDLVYKVEGLKNLKLFGFIPLSTDTTAYVSAQSGNVVSTDQSLISRIISNLSTD